MWHLRFGPRSGSHSSQFSEGVKEIPRDPLAEFLSACRAMVNPVVFELGTKRSIPTRSTRHDDWVPHARKFIGVDFQEGLDVDLVADVHRMGEVVGEEVADAIISCSTFEHLKYPFLAAHEITKVLKIGGVLFIQTHQTFPIHAYPYDYFRYTREALAALFGTRMGFEVVATGYDFPARIKSKREPGIRKVAAYLNTTLFGRKTGKTPGEYVYDL